MGARSSVCDSYEISVPKRAAQRNILLVLLFWSSKDLIELSIMFRLKPNTCINAKTMTWFS